MQKSKGKDARVDADRRIGHWEIDCVPEPMFGAIRPDGRPFDMILIADQESYFIFDSYVIAPNESIGEGVLKSFKKVADSSIFSLPQTIVVKKKELADILSPIAQKLNIPIHIVTRLKAITSAVRSMRQMRTGTGMNMSTKRNINTEPDTHDLYYDAMEATGRGDNVTAIKLLNRGLEIDQHSVQIHHGLSRVYREIGNTNKHREHTVAAYEETVKIFKKWPKELSWYDIDNRQYHRAIFFRANLHIEDGEIEQGLELYRQLLRMWPYDNLGVRYFAAGIYAGLTIQNIDDLWDECNDNQSWDKMEKMLTVQNRTHHFWQEPKDTE